MQSNNDISPLIELGWKPNTTIKEGLLKVIKFETESLKKNK
jgi:hypothetical protein